MKKILTYGTFDLIHFGHLKLLKRCKDLGGHLTVGISSDEFNLSKGKKSVMSFEERKELLEALSYVDNIIKEDTWDQKVEDIKKYDIDIFVMGDDWEGKFDYLKEYCEVVYLPRTKSISTTEIKKILEKDNELENVYNVVDGVLEYDYEGYEGEIDTNVRH